MNGFVLQSHSYCVFLLGGITLSLLTEISSNELNCINFIIESIMGFWCFLEIQGGTKKALDLQRFLWDLVGNFLSSL